MMTTRRALLGATLATTLATPRLVRAAPAGAVTVVGYFGIFQDNYTKAVLDPFMKKFPDVKVTFRPVRGSADATAILRTQRGRPQTDVMIMDMSVAAQNNREGLFAPLDPGVVASLADLPAWARPEGHMGAAVTQDVEVLLLAPKRLAQQPKTWADLADPAYKGRAALPLGDVRGTVLLSLLCRQENEDYKQSVDKGIALMKRIAANAQTFEPQPDVYTAIRSGICDVGIGWNARGQSNQDQAPGEFAAIVPVDGTAPQVNTINLVANAPNPAAAQAFIDYALGPDAQKAFAEALYYGPVNSKVELEPALAGRIFGTPEAKAKQLDLDWTWFSRHNNALLTRIRREVMAA